MKISFLFMILSLFMVFGKVEFAYSQNAGFFDGYKTMEFPRDQIPLGAIWTNVGPMGNGVDDTKLDFTESYEMLSKLQDRNLVGSLEANVLGYLQTKLGAEYFSNVKVHLKSVTLVKVKDLDLLKANIGNKILYEAIRANEVLFEVDKSLSSQIKAGLFKVFKNSNISIESASGDKNLIKASGANLYIAYRVIELVKGKEKSKSVTFRPQSASSNHSVNLKSNYYTNTKEFNITLCPCAIIDCINANRDIKNCIKDNKWQITIVDQKNISSGVPKKQDFYKNLPFDIWNENIPLRNEIRSDGINIVYLNIEHLFFDLKDSLIGYIALKGNNERVKIVENNIIFKDIAVKGVNGW